jgi:hypothetical protein
MLGRFPSFGLELAVGLAQQGLGRVADEAFSQAMPCIRLLVMTVPNLSSRECFYGRLRLQALNTQTIGEGFGLVSELP